MHAPDVCVRFVVLFNLIHSAAFDTEELPAGLRTQHFQLNSSTFAVFV